MQCFGQGLVRDMLRKQCVISNPATDVDTAVVPHVGYPKTVGRHYGDYLHCSHGTPPIESITSLIMMYGVCVISSIDPSISRKRAAYGPIRVLWNFIVTILPSFCRSLQISM